MDFQVSTRPLSAGAQKGYQLATLDLPSDEVLWAIGRAIVLFAQLEHLLKIVHKRTDGTISLDKVLRLKVSLGGLLSGSREFGENMEFDGLIKLAECNPKLVPIADQLKQLKGLVTVRNKYVHNGIGKNRNGNLLFLNSGQELNQSDMLKELDDVSNDIRRLMPHINEAIPPSGNTAAPAQEKNP